MTTTVFKASQSGHYLARTRRQTTRQRALAAFFAIMGPACGGAVDGLEEQLPGDGADGELSVVKEPLLNASSSTSNPINNSTVWINGCTGTLVAPDVVLTCGHCFSGHANAGIARQNGNWWPLAQADEVEVRFGANPESPVLTARGTWFNQVARNAAGIHADILMFGLDQLVPNSVAVPREVLTTAPADLNPRSHAVYGYGFGSGSPGRTFALVHDFGPVAGSPEQMLGRLFGEALITGGDSGGPTYYGGTNGPIMAVTQGWNGAGTLRTTKTFNVGDARSADIAGWLSRTAVRTKCSATESSASVSDSGKYSKLSNWWSPARADNYLTTAPGWTGCVAGFDRVVDHDGYYFFRQDGWVASPSRAQPAGTIPLYESWNATFSDNATLTFVPAGWARFRVTGYIWTTPGPTRISLKSWYSATRGDYITTTNGEDYSAQGYAGPTILGYVMSNSSVR